MLEISAENQCFIVTKDISFSMKIMLKWAVMIGQMKCLRNWTNNDYSVWFLRFCAIIEMIDDQIDLDLSSLLVY